MKSLGKPFEIVFASVDNDEDAMKSYFAEMPWLAIPYDADERKIFMATYQVQRHWRREVMRMMMGFSFTMYVSCVSYVMSKVRSIPRLIIFSPEGYKVEDNAVGQQYLTDGAFSMWERGMSATASTHGGGGGGCCGGGKCG